jgi:ABC-type transporter Mla MlaB component
MARYTVSCDCSSVAQPDLATVDALLRLDLSLKRCDCELRLKGAGVPLRELIDFAGLAEVLRVEVGRQAEEREDPLRVEEEGELDDLSF